MNILSLFDGMSCGQIALNRLGITVDTYYASEVDKYAIAVTQHNYPNTIQLGDVTKWRDRNIDRSSIDLLQGGSPCQGFSLAGKQLNFEDPRSKLFFVFVDILNHIRKHNPKVKFLLENVRMKKEYQDIITKHIGVQPIKINSALVSAQNRVRLYWTNITPVEQLKDKKIYLKDIIESGVYDKDNSYCIDANYQKGANLKKHKEKGTRKIIFDKPLRVGNTNPSGRGQNGEVYDIGGKSPTLTTNKGEGPKIIQRGRGYIIRKLTPIECERLQTVPDNYTLAPHPVYKGKDMSNAQRYKMLGNGWTVDVISHIYRNIL